MSLTKLFNFNYLKQNLKKSKGILTLITLVIPVITALVLVSYNSDRYASILYGFDLSFVNIIGMYVMPIILSSALFGYVYKRNSVDFINSMPMSRKTIYATNFLAGLIIILLAQVLTLIVNIVCSYTLTSIFLPMSVIFDIFVFMLVSYIFVYAATALAMTVSGNLLTQIVVTMLIIFLVPFIMLVGNGLTDVRDLNLDIGNNVLVLNEVTIPEFTSPFGILTTILYGNSRGLYSPVAVVKMVVLSVIYFLLGMYLFDKRKMENVEKSFSKTWVHLLVKGITLVPMIFIIRAGELEDIPLVIAVTLTFIYYVIYDFITNRKVALKITIPTFIVSCLILVGFYQGINYINEEMLVKNISMDEIASVSVEVELINSSATYKNEELDVEICDESIINQLCTNLISNEEQQTFYETAKLDSDYPVYKDMKIKLRNGKEIYINATISAKTYKNVVDKLLSDETYKNKYEEMVKYDEIAIIYDGKMLNKDATEEIRKLLNNVELQTLVDSQEDEDLYKYGVSYVTGNNSPNIRFYQYKNHEFRTYHLNKTLTPEIFKTIVNAINKESYEELTSKEIDTNKMSLYIDSYILPGNKEVELSSRHFDSKKELINYIKQHALDVCDINKPYYVFSGYCYNLSRNIYIHLNSTDELNSLINEYVIIEPEETMIKYVNDVVYE